MSTSSIARQKRREQKRLRLASLHLDSSLNSSSLILNAKQFDNPAYLEIGEGCSASDIGDNAQTSGNAPSETTGCSYISCDASSKFTGKIYVEDQNGFREVDANVFFQSFNKSQETAAKTDLAIGLAYQAEKYFHNFSFLCHGLLGGLGFIEALMLVHFILSPREMQETLRHFQFLSQPIHNVFNFLCTICCVSAFDRFDVGSPKEFFSYLKKCKFKMIILIIYPACLLLSFSTANVDEKLCLPEKNATLWESFTLEDEDHDLFYWTTLSTVKCFGTLLAWFVVSLEPNKNLFLVHLKNVLQRNSIISK